MLCFASTFKQQLSELSRLELILSNLQILENHSLLLSSIFLLKLFLIKKLPIKTLVKITPCHVECCQKREQKNRVFLFTQNIKERTFAPFRKTVFWNNEWRPLCPFHFDVNVLHCSFNWIEFYSLNLWLNFGSFQHSDPPCYYYMPIWPYDILYAHMAYAHFTYANMPIWHMPI